MRLVIAEKPSVGVSIDGNVERCGLGTPATRAAVIEKLVSGGSVVRNGRKLIPTESGINLVNVLPDKLKSAELTAEWENHLSQIAEGKLDPDAFMRGIEEYVKDLVREHNK